MDKSTNEVRTLSWAAIIEQCQARPEGQSAKQWLKANGISEKQYYYWLRKLRKQAYEQSLSNNSPALFEKCMPEVAFAEIPSDGLFSSDPVTAVTIKTRKLTLDVSSAVPVTSLVEIVKAVANAV
jgi:putative transposase